MKRMPKALREHVWKVYFGDSFSHKCWVNWCENIVTPFTFEVGHNVPRSKGGTDNLDNLRPICSSCNKSMGNQYTIDEFSDLSARSANFLERFRYSPPARGLRKDTGSAVPRGTPVE